MQELSPIEWALRPIKKYASFKGRAPRAEYWWFYLATIIAQIVLTMIDNVLGKWSQFSTIFSLLTLVPWLAVTVRRLHDTNRSGWWVAILGIGFLATGLLVGLAATSSDKSAFGFTATIIGLVLLFFSAISLLVFMVLRGTEGPNRYGPDPYGPDELETVFA